MGLDFTSVKDHEGAAVLLLYAGMSQQRHLERIADEIRQQDASIQTVLLAARDKNAERICAFYGLKITQYPHIVVVRDNDELMHVWSGLQIPMTETIVHTVRQYSAG